MEGSHQKILQVPLSSTPFQHFQPLAYKFCLSSTHPICYPFHRPLFVSLPQFCLVLSLHIVILINFYHMHYTSLFPRNYANFSFFILCFLKKVSCEGRDTSEPSPTFPVLALSLRTFNSLPTNSVFNTHALYWFSLLIIIPWHPFPQSCPCTLSSLNCSHSFSLYVQTIEYLSTFHNLNCFTYAKYISTSFSLFLSHL